MFNSLLSNITVSDALMVSLLVLVVVLLILLTINNRKIHNITYPVYDYIVKGAQEKAQEITWDAMKNSRKMLVDAELEGVKVIAKEKLESRKIEEEYEKN